MNILGMRIKAEREKKKKTHSKWTQEYVANLIGVARPTYTAYENGTKEPPLDTLDKIADLFNVSIDYLHGRTNVKTTINNDFETEQAEFEAFINNPDHGIFFKEYLESPEERKKDLMTVWRIIKEAEKGRKPDDRQK